MFILPAQEAAISAPAMGMMSRQLTKTASAGEPNTEYVGEAPTDQRRRLLRSKTSNLLFTNSPGSKFFHTCKLYRKRTPEDWEIH
jgi:hypothetical protein